MRYEVIVVGGSFAGLSAAMQLARARRRVLVLDAGSPRNRFARLAYGIFGHDGLAPAVILANARTQLLNYSTATMADDPATHAAGARGEFAVTTAGGAAHTASRLVLATGVSDDLSTIPGMETRWGVSVLHCFYCHGYEVAERRLGVLATNERALQTAMLLPDWSDHVTLFTHGALALSGEQMDGLRARGVAVEASPVVALLGDAPALTGLRLADGRVAPLDALFTSPHVRMASPLAEQLGCEFEQGPSGPFIRTGADKQTTVPGVYAAGDAARPGHNASWAAADGVTAGISAHQSLTLARAACR
ncbi:MAG: NAD(P)/FAD-dependent oxidoreductase [Acidobacteria bacterium]|nr:NAD(P)/FAD-dependent oxidoreductase [Acidobacteriota bacterium]